MRANFCNLLKVKLFQEEISVDLSLDLFDVEVGTFLVLSPYFYLVWCVTPLFSERVPAQLYPLAGLHPHDAHLSSPLGQGRHLRLRYPYPTVSTS